MKETGNTTRETLFVKKENGDFVPYEIPLHEKYREVKIEKEDNDTHQATNDYGNKIISLPRRKKR